MIRAYATWARARFNLGGHDERGGPLVEYIFMLAFLTVIVVVVIKVLGNTISEKGFSAMNHDIRYDNCQPAPC